MSRPIGSVLVLLAALGALVAVIGTGCGGAAGGPTDGDTIAPPDELGTGTITGSVVDASDTSLAIGNAYVHVPRASVASAYSPAYLRAVNYAHTHSAEDGSYRLESLPAGRLTMIVDPPPNSGYAGLIIELDVAAGASINIRVTLAKTDLANQVSAVTVDPPNATVQPGGTQQYTATVLGAGATTLDLAPVWVTTGGAGTIDENGLFTAGSEEKSGTIVAVVGAYSGSTTVSVATPDNPPPTVSLDVAPPSGQAPLTVAAAATASDSNGSVASVSLDWGDGSGVYTNTAFPANLPHTYGAAGDYTVTATATDDQGAQGSATAVVHVTDHAIVAPTCSLSATPASGAAPLNVAFTGAGTDADGTISSWTLNFGDGSALWTGSSAPSGLSHAYSSAGTYTAMLTVVDNDGASASATQTISVSTTDCKPPTAALTATPTSGTAPLTVSFNGSGTDPNSGGSIVEYRLDFQGDGTDDWARTSPPTNVTYVYSAAGTYVPKLTVVNACGTPGSSTQTVQVTPPPALSVSPTSLDFGLTDTSETFSIANTGGGTLSWSVTEASDWITGLAPSSGAGGGTVTVTVDRAGLSGGTHTASVSVNSNGGTATVTVSIGSPWDAANDYSTTVNPEGAWSHGWSSDPTQPDTFALYAWCWQLNELDAWGATYHGLPGVSKNNTDHTVAPSGVTYIPGMLAGHPGSGGEYSIIRWTAPSAGQYQVAAWFAEVEGTTTGVAVYHNGAALWTDSIWGEGDTGAWDHALAMDAGDTLDFAIGNGGNGYFNDTTRVEALISR